jgi:hypothetical protein
MVHNEVVILLGIITAGLIIINLWISIQISQELKRHHIQANIAHRRGVIFKYLKIYKSITTEKKGRPGSLYYLFLLTFALFMIFLLSGILLSSL